MNLDYELLDSGNELKWERFGNNSVVRPDPLALWQPRSSPRDWRADARCQRGERGAFVWQREVTFVEPWTIGCGPLTFELRLSQSKNVGIFPEQQANWQWLTETIGASKEPFNILNLFAYTGGATLVAALAGAQVCHVDAAKSTVRWASHNQELSGLSDRPIRWIVDDAIKFLRREIARGVRYDGIILDPPPLGHGTSGVFAFKKHALELLALSKQVLRDKPLLFLFNCYALNYTPAMAKGLVQEIFGPHKMQSGELVLHEKKRPKTLSCSVYVRFRSID